MARKILELEQNKDVITTIIFQTRNIPSALYKTLGGFATNGINIVKLESYMIETGFYSAQFYVDIEGNPACKNMQLFSCEHPICFAFQHQNTSVACRLQFKIF
jgi:prephenate dehydratase